MQRRMAPQKLTDGCVKKAETSQGEKSKETYVLCKSFGDTAIQKRTDQEGQAETEAADAVEYGDLSVGEIDAVRSVCCAGHKGVQAKGKNKDQDIENHDRIPFFGIIFIKKNIALFQRTISYTGMRTN